MKVRFHYGTIDDAMKTVFEPKDWDDFCKHLTNKYWDTNEISCKLYYDKPDRRIGWEKTWIIKTKVYNPSNPSIPFVYIPIAFSNGDITKLKGYKEKMTDTQLREKEMLQTLINDRYKMINKIKTIICNNINIRELTTTKT